MCYNHIKGDSIVKYSLMFAVYGYSTVPKNWADRFGGNINRLYYIHAGNGGYIFNGKKYPFEKDTLYLLPHNLDVVPYSDPENPILHTYCDFDAVPLISSSQVISYKVKNNIDKHALNLFCDVGKNISETRKRDPMAKLDSREYEFYSSAIAYLVSVITENNKQVVINDEIIFRSIEYMYDNMDKDITIEQLAATAYMSVGWYIKRFKAVSGQTPYSYLKRIRLSYAIYLKSLGHKLDYVAERVGYSDSVALLHAIKKLKTLN